MKSKVWFIVVLLLLLILVGGLAYRSKQAETGNGKLSDSGINSEQEESQSVVDGVGISLNENALIF